MLIDWSRFYMIVRHMCSIRIGRVGHSRHRAVWALDLLISMLVSAVTVTDVSQPSQRIVGLVD